jgi:branched-chain amino acid transport system permease protein
LRYSRLGIRIRAGTLDLETVAALGINVGRLRALNFAVGIFLAGLSGERGHHVRADGRGPADPTARPARRRRHDDMSEYLHPPRLLVIAALWAALLLAPYWMPLLGGYTALGTRVLVLGLAAMSVNFLLGFTGVLSFGHAAYFGLGAYGAGLALKFLAPSTPLALLCGTLLGGIAGTLLGALIARRRGVYFAMVTIAFGQVFYYIAFQWSSVTGGDDGLRGFSRQPLDLGVARIDILSNANAFYYFVLFCLALAIGVMGFILRSPFGRTMIAIRENERRARFLGIPVDRHIWIAFTLSCFFMGFAGALYALLNNFADPRGLHYSQSGDFVMMAVMGGMRSLWGPLLGAAVFVVLQDYLSSVTVNWMSFVGMLFVAIVLFFPRGLLGFIQRRSDS